jgi:hypothetical protein
MQGLRSTLLLGINTIIILTQFKVCFVLEVHHCLRLDSRQPSDFVAPTSALEILQYAQRASWDPSLVCLPGTRVALLDNIWSWIQTADHTKSGEIFFLSDVAGAGKSAIAHTIAERCHHAGLLASSFFFNRDEPDRNNPRLLFTSIARDLSSMSKEVNEQICAILEANRNIASAPLTRQFDELILGLSRVLPLNKPIVIVIDALDEGYSSDLLRIFRHRVPKLPGSFRLFITSRSEDVIVTNINAAHVELSTIDIHGETNQHDIGMYVKDRLRHIAYQRHLSDGWPGPELSNEFRTKAEGLFIWVSTMSEYLSSDRTYDPTSKLRSLLSNASGKGLPPETKMDKLYADILNSCNWSDEEFAEMYRLVMGSIMAAKTPLTATGIQSLHQTTPIQVLGILRPLNTVFTGVDGKGQCVRIVHASFRDFVTRRAQLMPDYSRFHVSEKAHSQRFALLCLCVLNRDLETEIAGTGYLSGRLTEVEGIPHITPGQIGEALWYACCFWMEHVVDIEDVAAMPNTFLDMLGRFLSTHLVRWLELVVSMGQFQELSKMRRWLQVSCIDSESLVIS